MEIFGGNTAPKRRVKLAPKAPWDCSHCGLTGIKTHYHKCPICQTPHTESK